MDGSKRKATPDEVLARMFGSGARVIPSDPATTPAWLRDDGAWERADRRHVEEHAAAQRAAANAGVVVGPSDVRPASVTTPALPGVDGAR